MIGLADVRPDGMNASGFGMVAAGCRYVDIRWRDEISFKFIGVFE